MTTLADILDKAYETKALTDLVDAPVDVLAGVSEKDAVALRKAFGIRTIRDLGTNKYFLWAQGIVQLGTGYVSERTSPAAEAHDAQRIEAHPDVPAAGEARLRESAVPVWAIIGHYLAVNRDAEQVAKDYDVESADVQAALRYFQEHSSDIIARLRENGFEETLLVAAEVDAVTARGRATPIPRTTIVAHVDDSDIVLFSMSVSNSR